MTTGFPKVGTAFQTRHLCLTVSFFASLMAFPAVGSAFCGFYVSGADSSLYSNATMVVMMRDGRRTVLSMQNNYQGPPEDFAMVVPVPVVLSEDSVRTLDRAIFERVDQLAAPRLVEYWEQDPCRRIYEGSGSRLGRSFGGDELRRPQFRARALGVTVEAEFTVAEYEIVLLSARDSSGLDTWLRQERYNIPAGTEEVLRPYVEQGTKFFVAKVDSSKVTFENGRAVLSPLRMHYDADTFSLPVRLGLLNSSGQQDLIVHILARGQRYQVANYNNRTIPTNLVVEEGVRSQFAGFYDLLFRRASGAEPRTVVTEYAWDASSCDPCPVPALSRQEIQTLGGDVIGEAPAGGLRRPNFGNPRARRAPSPTRFVLTRLHYRYGREGLSEDLLFEAATPIVGGRGTPDREGHLTEEGVQAGRINNFQGRYVMLNRWDGPVNCTDPVVGRWGGPPGQGEAPRTTGSTNPAMRATAPELVSAIGPLVRQSVPQIGVVAGQIERPLPHDPGALGDVEAGAAASSTDEPTPSTDTASTTHQQASSADAGCASCSSTGSDGIPGALALLACVVTVLRRRRGGNPVS